MIYTHHQAWITTLEKVIEQAKTCKITIARKIATKSLGQDRYKVPRG